MRKPTIGSPADTCPCGLRYRDHYPNTRTRAYMLRETRELGAVMSVETTDGTFSVPRHFLVNHAWRPWEIAGHAARHGWRRLAAPLRRPRRPHHLKLLPARRCG